MEIKSVTSSTIDIFPTAKPRTISLSNLNGDGRLFYEHSLTKLFSALCDSDCFIVDYTDNILEVIMKGYHIRLDIIENLPSREELSQYRDIYLELKLTNETRRELAYADDISNNTFPSLNIVMKNNLEDMYIESETNNVISYYLKVFDISDGNLIPCKESFYRMNIKSLNISKIDGKHE